MATRAVNFQSQLQWGQVGESIIARWLRTRGWTILPVYEKEIDTGKGPRLFTAYQSGYNELVATDMLAMKGRQIQWVEGKRKTGFSWRWTRKVWQDGIDLRHYEDYVRVREHTNLPLWILFLHQNACPSERDLEHGCDPECPTGLYGGEIEFLEKHIAHKDKFEANGRSYPMVYWDREHLMPGGKPLATLEQIQAILLPQKPMVDMKAIQLQQTMNAIGVALDAQYEEDPLLEEENR